MKPIDSVIISKYGDKYFSSLKSKSGGFVLADLPYMQASEIGLVNSTQKRSPVVYSTGGTTSDRKYIEWYPEDLKKSMSSFLFEELLDQEGYLLSTISSSLSTYGASCKHIAELNALGFIELPRYATGSLRLYEDVFNKKNIKILTVVPSVLKRMLRDDRLPLAELSFIISAGAPITPTLRDAVTQNLPTTKLIDFYGMTECSTIALSTSRCHRLHIDEKSVIVEILNEDVEGIGEIVVTSLLNRRTPIIRYKTGDMGRIGSKCACGNNSPVITLTGRISETIYFGGTKVTLQDVEQSLGKVVKNIDEFQVLYDNREQNERVEILFSSSVRYPDLTANFIDATFELNLSFYQKMKTGKIRTALIQVDDIKHVDVDISRGKKRRMIKKRF